MFDSIFSAVSSNTGLIAGGGTAAIVLWVLKKVPNDYICEMVETMFYGLGKAMTLGLSKWSLTKKFWNRTIEPWVIDAIDNIVANGIKSFCDGMRSDN